MRNHTLTVRGREATCSDLELVQGTVMEDAVRLDLDGEWDGLDVTYDDFPSPPSGGEGLSASRRSLGSRYDQR